MRPEGYALQLSHSSFSFCFAILSRQPTESIVNKYSRGTIVGRGGEDSNAVAIVIKYVPSLSLSLSLSLPFFLPLSLRLSLSLFLSLRLSLSGLARQLSDEGLQLFHSLSRPSVSKAESVDEVGALSGDPAGRRRRPTVENADEPVETADGDGASKTLDFRRGGLFERSIDIRLSAALTASFTLQKKPKQKEV